MLFFFLMLSVIALLCGCGTTTPPTPPPPASATLTVYSSSYWVYGYVWVNGFSTGEYLDYNGAVTIPGLTPGLTSVQIKDEYGYSSHIEYITLVPGNNNIVNFTSW
jgi:cytochrome c biogenesis factor